MNQALSNVISTIVKSHGSAIIAEPRFRYILQDSYPFNDDMSLKMAFQSVWESDYCSRLYAASSSKDVIGLIRQEVNGYAPNGSYTKDEYKDCLETIAIGSGKVTFKDLYPNVKPPKPNGPTPPKAPRKPISSYKGFWPTLIWSIIANVLCFVTYGLFLGGWWLFWAILIVGFFQLGIYANLGEKFGTEYSIKVGNRILIPGMCSFSLFYFLSPLFCTDFFCHGIGFHGEKAGTLGIILCYLVALMSWGMVFSSSAKLNVKKSILPSCLACAITISIFIFFGNLQNIENQSIINNQQKIADRNASLIEDRKSKTEALAFKGIKLDSHISELLKTIEGLKANDSIINTTFVILDENQAINLNEHDLNMEFATDLDNVTMVVGLFLYEDKLGKIILRPSNSKMQYSTLVRSRLAQHNIEYASRMYDKSVSHNQLVGMYMNKYGDPEVIDVSSYEFDRLRENDFSWITCRWTFPTGDITITPRGTIGNDDSEITYTSLGYRQWQKRLEQMEETRRKHVQDSIQQRKFIEEQEQLKAKRADSLRQIELHKRALQDI